MLTVLNLWQKRHPCPYMLLHIWHYFFLSFVYLLPFVHVAILINFHKRGNFDILWINFDLKFDIILLEILTHFDKKKKDKMAQIWHILYTTYSKHKKLKKIQTKVKQIQSRKHGIAAVAAAAVTSSPCCVAPSSTLGTADLDSGAVWLFATLYYATL